MQPGEQLSMCLPAPDANAVLHQRLLDTEQALALCTCPGQRIVLQDEMKTLRILIGKDGDR